MPVDFGASGRMARVPLAGAGAALSALGRVSVPAEGQCIQHQQACL